MYKTFDPSTLRNPASAELRRLVSLAQEDAGEDILAAFGGLGVQVNESKVDINEIRKLIQILGPFFAGLLQREPPAPVVVPAPVPAPAPQPGPTPTPAPTPAPLPVAAIARIIGGRARFTGLTERGAQGPRVKNWKEIVGGGDNAPNDCRFELDCTPSDGVSDFGPTVDGVPDPRWAGQPWNSPGWAFPMRLFFTYEGPGSADLVHEYANFGCTPRIRVRQPEGSSGVLSEVFFKGPDYGDGKAPAIITVSEGPIYIGRH